MSKAKKGILIVFLGLLIGGYFMYNYMYKDHRNIQTEEAKVNVSSQEMVALFKDNDSPEILNSTVQVTGIITEMNDKSITLDDGVQCSFDANIENQKVNDKVTVKGRCIGYDDLFEIVKLDQSTIIK